MGFSGQAYWSGMPCPPSGDLPNPGIEPTSLVSLVLQADSLPAEPPGKTLELSRSQFRVSLDKREGGRGCRRAAEEALAVTLEAGVWGGERGPAGCLPCGCSGPGGMVCAAHFIALCRSSTDTTSAVLCGLPTPGSSCGRGRKGGPFSSSGDLSRTAGARSVMDPTEAVSSTSRRNAPPAGLIGVGSTSVWGLV